MRRSLVLSLGLHAAALGLVLAWTAGLPPRRVPAPVTVRLSGLPTGSSPQASRGLEPALARKPAGASRPAPTARTAASEPAELAEAPGPPAPEQTAPLPGPQEPTPPGPLETRSSPGEPPVPAAEESAPVLVSAPQPAYPREARKRGWEGVVEIEAEVDETGRPKALAVVRSSGYPVLDRTALEALGQAVFRPGTRDNLPAAGRTTVTVRFSLR